MEYPGKFEVIECREGATASGKILLNVEGLTDILESSVSIFSVTPPDADQEKWTTSGSDLYAADVFTLTFSRLSDGRIVANWCFYPVEITGIGQGFYAVTIYINSDSSANVKQACVEFIVKVKNSISIGN
jgi:hypothetical protein